MILSDLDDTFRGGPGTVEEHSKAIRYFTENGGKFSFATGRGAAYVKRQDFYGLVNAPGCLFNGGYVYDFAADTYLRKTFLPFTVGQFVDAIKPHGLPVAQLHVPFDSFVCAEGEDIYNLPENVREFTAMKVVTVLRTQEDAAAYRAMYRDIPLLRDTYISRSWDVGVEFTASNGTKGHALDFIKAYLGNIHTAVGVGNYDNDVPLLQHADIGVAVANAPEEVQQAADLVVPACNEFGLCALIDILESKV